MEVEEVAEVMEAVADGAAAEQAVAKNSSFFSRARDGVFISLKKLRLRFSFQGLRRSHSFLCKVTKFYLMSLLS